MRQHDQEIQQPNTHITILRDPSNSYITQLIKQFQLIISHSYLASHINEQLSIFPKKRILMRKVTTHIKIGANTENDHNSSSGNPMSNLLQQIC